MNAPACILRFWHAAGRRDGQDMKWLQEVRRMGTTADKVAAMTLLLQESAVSNLRSLDELLRWVSKRSGARAVAGQVRAMRLPRPFHLLHQLPK